MTGQAGALLLKITRLQAPQRAPILRHNHACQCGVLRPAQKVWLSAQQTLLPGEAFLLLVSSVWTGLHLSLVWAGGLHSRSVSGAAVGPPSALQLRPTGRPQVSMEVAVLAVICWD